MSKESDKSTPVPTPHDKEHARNQSTEVERNKPKSNVLLIVVAIIVVLVIIAAFSGWLDF
ncbi:hypothetical protein FHG64_07775 [Antarcticibacterium flavum]|uniref:Uncharacterized protein n=1 Tax=Antarcticibacterium flavum TaxID=2058175 RepID=A0A5B7X1U4_9FLAO|nr:MULTISPECIES: hypothetical protein [Antarcticibacterium]MCM4161465.1 hypothetical protein [Antarcticibacterium sp. W02-3]QCY69299.1 hypothetical protein FHG64_07775 [Antarcticibacterium flavum]